MKLHLHQFLGRTGMFKRKSNVIDAVKNSEVKIDNQVINNPMYRFNPHKRSVYWKNKKLEILYEKVYIILNKPPGYLSTKLTEKDLDKQGVFDLIGLDENLKNTLFAVGRLDEESSGLLIITNDGKLGYKITNPRSQIEKTYHVHLEKPVSNIQMIEQGVIIDLEIKGKTVKYKTRKCKIDVITDKELNITLIEGKKREVRRIFEAVGNKVLKLKRRSIGKLKINIDEGCYMFTTKAYIEDNLK